MRQLINLKDLKLTERVHARGGRFSFYPLLEGQAGTQGNFYLQLSRTYADFESPRHRHNFDQIRIQIESDADFARDGVMTPGTVGYFPEGVFYGPQTISGESLTLVLQFGGASGSGYLSEAEFQNGIAELKPFGTFDKGVYKVAKPEGGSRNQDAYEAVWEHVHGRELRYPEDRYAKPVFMKPSAAAWRPDGQAAGVSRKHLGTFSEAMTRVSMLKLDPDAQVVVEPRTALFVLQGEGAVDGDTNRQWEKWSSLFTGDEAMYLSAQSASEVVEIRLPTLPAPSTASA